MHAYDFNRAISSVIERQNGIHRQFICFTSFIFILHFFSLCFYVGLVTVSYLQCLFASASAPLSCVVVTCIRIMAWNRNQKMHKHLVATRQQIGNCVCCSRAQSNKTTHISFKCIQCNIHTHTMSCTVMVCVSDSCRDFGYLETNADTIRVVR